MPAMTYLSLISWVVSASSMIFHPHLLIFLIASVSGFSTKSGNAKKASDAAMAVVVAIYV